MADSLRPVVFSVDPGVIAGWGLVTIGSNPRPIDSGKIEFAHPRRGEFRNATEALKWASSVREVAIVAIEDQYLDDDPRKIASMIKLCRSAGRWEEAAAVCGVPHKYVNPSTWQTAMLGSRMKRDQLKVFSRRVVASRFRMTCSEHVADAILIGAHEAIELWYEQSTGGRATRRPARKGCRTPRRGTASS